MSIYILEQLEMHFPHVSENMESYESDGIYGLFIRMKDGRKLYYDNIDDSIWKLPDDKDNMTEEEYRREFGRRLRMIMRRQGINQLTLAEQAGLTQPQLSKYMNGKTTASSYVVRKIARVLNCSLDELLYT